jgi:hypothetical protein
MSNISRRSALLAGIAVAGVLLVAAPAMTEPVVWDQKRVQNLAEDLATHVSNIKKGIAHARETADPKSPRWVVLDDLMQLQHRVVALVVLLSAGEGRDATEPVFRRVRSAVEHARDDAPAFPDVQKQARHIDKANAALDKLAAFYE